MHSKSRNQETQSKSRRKQTLAFCLAALSLLSTAQILPPFCLAGASSQSTRSHPDQDTKEKLKEIERKRHEAQEKLRLAREKERKAMQKLHVIRSQLNSANRALNSGKHELARTETRLQDCQSNLTVTSSQKQSVESQAAARLRQMYEGQRLSLLDMLFQVSSLQQLMDLLYFQERVAEQDRKLLAGLRARAQELEKQKNRLGQQRMQLGDIVTEFAKKALMLNKEKSEQEVVAEKLRSQRAFYEAAEHQLARESHQLESQIMQMINAHKGQTNKVVSRGSGSMQLPLKAPITSPFGWRRHPIFGVRKFHTGVDLAGPNRSPIKAADGGNVLYSGWYGGYGRVVIVNHGNGLATLYAHMSKLAVGAGDNVSKGDVVGYEGSTGFSTGPHLHFEVRVDGKPNNPLNYAH